ncbi:carboxypeptidase-like regulatory domain-containing protein [Deinococcus yavapaiensis]|uniref:Carboxypeptidase family protein n=1 Tax=Deinococcus yavapaiensis KR-236 TaxID=694435 RepID=A0A318S8M8_9DEIO|nr:carboxypeptidase-like regulatory domain-containing protein [Deinococcus yavapaiensis]PYE52756.1 carboxypeptidase family protein [Deinococcus yavapaiensis KR-236]
MNDPRRHATFAATLALAATASAFTSAPPPLKPEPGFAQGQVLDTRGAPVPGAKIIVDSTVLRDVNLITKTDARGRYRVPLPPLNSWRVYASIEREYHGRTYAFDLHPTTDKTFSSVQGGVSDFRWQLTGEKTGGSHGTYGGTVLASAEAGDFSIEGQAVELTLTPNGPLVDGNPGTTIKAKVAATGDGLGLADVPIGRYTVTARYAPPGETSRALLVRLEGVGEYGERVTGDFTEHKYVRGAYQLRLDVRLP